MTELKTLYHRGDPDTSKEAAEKMLESEKLAKQEQLVLEAILKYTEFWEDKTYCEFYRAGQPGGFIARELVFWLEGNDGHWNEKHYFLIQRRLSGLHRKGYIERTGEKRDGCCVWHLKK